MKRRVFGHFLTLCAVAALASPPFADAANVMTQHNDNTRSGANLAETILRPANLAGLEPVTRSLDGDTTGQPLYLHGVNISGVKRNIVIVATMNNTIYAYNADNRSAAKNTPPAWIRHFDQPGLGTSCGIESTPAVDPDTNQLYAVYCVFDAGGGKSISEVVADEVALQKTLKKSFYLARINVADGTLIGTPVELRGSVTTPAAGVVRFDARPHKQRAALLLDGGFVYIGFAGRYREELGEYYGWVLRYSTSTLASAGAFNNAPNTYVWTGGDTSPPISNDVEWWQPFGGCWGAVNGRAKPWTYGDGSWWMGHHDFRRCAGLGGGIWQGGGGIAADLEGNIYYASGNGHYAPADLAYGDALVKLKPSPGGLSIMSSFAPEHLAELEHFDVDLGSGGPIVDPDSDTVFTGGKTGIVYNVGASDMHPRQALFAGYNQYKKDEPEASWRYRSWNCGPHFHGSPTYWRATPKTAYLYQWAEKDYLKRYRFDRTKHMIVTGANPWDVQGSIVAAGSKDDCSHMPGGMLSFTGNPAAPGSEILWAALQATAGNPESLYAFDPTTLDELWHYPVTNINHWASPTIADGKVFVTSEHPAPRLYIFARTKPQLPISLQAGPFPELDRVGTPPALLIDYHAWEHAAMMQARHDPPGYAQDPHFRSRLVRMDISTNAGGVVEREHLLANGSVLYAWTPADGGGAWKETGVDLTFSDAQRGVRGTIKDGRIVAGTASLPFQVVRSAAWPGFASWQLLRPTAAGTGPFAGAAFVQRVHTVGGGVPAQAGQPGETRRVPVKAVYVLMAPAR